MSDIDFYEVSKDYIYYLKKFESKIPDISYDKHDKFVCGIVLKVNNMNYFAPISSFNKKQRTNILIFNENGKPISSIRFSFMFPAPKEVLILKDFKKEEEKYRYLLMLEHSYCNRHKEEIYQKAAYVYKRVISGYDEMMQKNCCNFKLLEQKCLEYGKYLALSQSAVSVEIQSSTKDKPSIIARLSDIRNNRKEKSNGNNEKIFPDKSR